MAEIRLNKIIADAGVASRRAADQLITEGRVTVDGDVIKELGKRFDPEISEIKVDGESLKTNKSKTYLAFHKPAGVISTMTDPEG
ncbi:MAG: rRNA pseudouridine synthase, partial [Actinobacteria bacterium]|nr:rRNA pseudouridine synthase [Actinomycetota bacterium]